MDERLERFIATAQQIAGEVKETFGGLNEAQLNWKPSAEKMERRAMPRSLDRFKQA